MVLEQLEDLAVEPRSWHPAMGADLPPNNGFAAARRSRELLSASVRSMGTRFLIGCAGPALRLLRQVLNEEHRDAAVLTVETTCPLAGVRAGCYWA